MLPARRLGASCTLTLALVLAGGTPAATEVGLAPAALGPPPGREEEVVLAVELRRTTLSYAFLAYQRGDRLLLPLQELAFLLELPILVGDDQASAEGWFIAEDRRFRLDLTTGVAIADGRTVPLPPGSVARADDELYLDSEVLARLLPLDLAYQSSRSVLQVEPREPLPVDQRAARLARQSKLRRTGSPDDSDLVRLAIPYTVLDWPMADVNLDLSHDTGDGRPRADFDALATGDLLWMNARLFASGNRDGDLHNFRLNLARRDPDHDLLGPLEASVVELGDVDTGGQALAARAADGRGFALGNLPLGFISEFDRVTLQGDLRPGYEVELYRNGVLIDSLRPSAENRYEFRDISLLFGRNALTVVLYGPQGQRNEETRYFYVGPGLIPPGQLRYRASFLEKDETLFGLEDDRHDDDDRSVGKPRALVELEYGVNGSLSVGGGLAHVPLEDGGSSSIATLGLRNDLGRFFVTGDLGVSDNGGLAGRLGAQTILGRWNLNASHAEYRNGFRSERTDINNDADARIVSESRLRLFTGIGDGDLAGIDSLELIADHERRDDGRQILDLGPRLSGRVGRVSYSKLLFYSLDQGGGSNDPNNLDGSLRLSGAIEPFRLRGLLDYEVAPDPGFDAVSLSVGYPIDPRTYLDLTVDKNLDPDSDRGTEYRARLSRTFEPVRLSLFTAYDDGDDSVFVGVGLGFSLMRDPHTGRPVVSSRRLARSGGVATRVFADSNLNGRPDPGEAPIEGVEFAGRGAAARTATDAQGRGTLLGLVPDRPLQLRPRLGSIAEPHWEPAQPGYRIVPRPGKLSLVDVAIVPTGLVEGFVSLQRETAVQAVSNVILQLVPEGGAESEVSAEVRSEFDGYYVIERIRPGRYRLRVDPEQVRRLSLEPVREVPVAVTADGEERSGVDFTLRRRR